MDEITGPKSVTEILQIADFALDSYEDIFSDFDPSPYETRLLSQDFLIELRRRHAVTPKGHFSFNFTLPKALRSEKTENLIKKRIKEYFRDKVKETERGAQEHMRGGAIRLFIGIMLSLVLLVPQLDIVPIITLLSVLSWFSVWTGLEHISQASAHLGKKKAFAEKFFKAEYNFLSQEAVLESMQKLKGAVQVPKDAILEEARKSQGSSG